MISFRETKDPYSTFVHVTEKRWDDLEHRLRSLKARVTSVGELLNLPPASEPGHRTILEKRRAQKSRIVIVANPNRPPYSIKILLELLAKKNVLVTARTHFHSSVPVAGQSIRDFADINEDVSPASADLTVTFIWTNLERQAKMVVGGREIWGETDIARYLARQIDFLDVDTLSPGENAVIDSLVDVINEIVSGRADVRSKSEILCRHIKSKRKEKEGHTWLCGETLTIADILLLSCTLRNPASLAHPLLQEWRRGCSKYHMLKDVL